MWEPKDQNKKAEWINNMVSELQMREESLKWKYTTTHSSRQFKKYQTGKQKAEMSYTDFGLKNSLPSTTDWLP